MCFKRMCVTRGQLDTDFQLVTAFKHKFVTEAIIIIKLLWTSTKLPDVPSEGYNFSQHFKTIRQA